MAMAAAKKGKHVPVAKERKPTVEKQIEELREQMAAQQAAQKAQIDTLQQQLSASQTQLSQTQQQAQQAIQQATEALATQQAATAQNTQAVGTLQTAVADLTTNSQSIASTLQADQAATKKAIEHPDFINYKGITVSPVGSFVAFENVYRTRATSSDIATPFSSIPFSASDAGQLSELNFTARQTRGAVTAVGKLGNAELRAHYEFDFLGTGVTSNNNQSNSYVLRERTLWLEAALHNGLTVTGGQTWSLATETRTGLVNGTEMLPQVVDPNYNTGFSWERQPGFRLTYKINPFASAAISVEQAQTLAPGCSASTGGYCPINYLAGATGTNGGLYNGAGAPGGTSTGGTTITTDPTTLPTVDAFNAPVTTYAYNAAPDMIAKVALDPKFAHIELWGIARVFRNRIYPNESGQTGKAVSTTVAAGAGAYNDKTVGGAIGGTLRMHAVANKLDVGIKGMYGDGTSRYGDSQLADLTLRPDAQFALLHNFSTLGFLEAHVTPRLDLNLYYGGDYDGRRYFSDGTGTEGYGSTLLATSGCATEPAPGSTSGSGTVNGFSPSSVGSCAVNNKDVQEGTVSVWYDFYKGPMGRLRSGVQYSYIVRNTWSGLNGLAPKAVDDMVETTFRYYLP